jgi:hypothetical protein
MQQHGKPECHEFYCWAPKSEDGTERTEWYVLDTAEDPPRYERDPQTGAMRLVICAVAGPFDIDAAIKESAKRNEEIR